MLYLNTNDRANLQFATTPGFFGREVTPRARMEVRAVAMQAIVNAVRTLQAKIVDRPVGYLENEADLEVLWEVVTGLVGEANGESVLQSDGELVAVSRSVPDTVAATSMPSRKVLSRKA